MLTTLPTVKARLGLAEFDFKDDTLLTNYIALVSASFENDCNRLFGYKINETDEFQADETELCVRLYPIDEAQPITFQKLSALNSQLSTPSSGWQTVTDAEYILLRGCVISLISEIGRWKEQLRVTYTGGLFLPDMNPS